MGADPAAAPSRSRTAQTAGQARVDAADLYDASQGGSTCRKCGGWLGQLGLEPTPERFVEHLAGVFDEVRRVLRPDGTLWLNLGDTYATHPSGLTGEKRWKASTLSGRDRSGAEQAGRIDKRAPGLKPKDLVGIPWRVAFELQRRGWWLRSDCVWAKPNPMPEAVRDRPTRAHDSVFLLTKSRRYFYDAFARTRAPAGEHAPKTPPSSTEPDRQSHLPLEASRWGLPAIPDASKHEPLRPKSPDGVVDPDPALTGAPTSRHSRKSSPSSASWRGRPNAGHARSAGRPGRERSGRLEAPLAAHRNSRHQWCRVALPVADAPGRHDGELPDGLTWGSASAAPARAPKPFLVSYSTRSLGAAPSSQWHAVLGRRSIGIELKPEYVELARHRSSAEVPVVVGLGAATA